jgi:hypothetical protein
MTPRTADLPDTFGKLPPPPPHNSRPLDLPPFSFSPPSWGSHFSSHNSRIPDPGVIALRFFLIALRSPQSFDDLAFFGRKFASIPLTIALTLHLPPSIPAKACSWIFLTCTIIPTSRSF